jgi:hypothetical protein
MSVKLETVRRLQADQVDAVNGGGVTAGVAGGASTGASTGAAVSTLIGEPLTACPVVGGALSAIGGGIATAVHTW